MGDDSERKSLSVYDYSDPSIRHAWFAVLAYAALRALSTVVGMLREPTIAIWFVIDLVVVAVILGGLAFGFTRRAASPLCLRS